MLCYKGAFPSFLSLSRKVIEGIYHVLLVIPQKHKRKPRTCKTLKKYQMSKLDSHSNIHPLQQIKFIILIFYSEKKTKQCSFSVLNIPFSTLFMFQGGSLLCGYIFTIDRCKYKATLKLNVVTGI